MEPNLTSQRNTKMKNAKKIFKDIASGVLAVIAMVSAIPLGIGVLGLLGKFNNNDIFVTVAGIFGALAVMSGLAFSTAQTFEAQQKSSMNKVGIHLLRGVFFSLLALVSQAILKLSEPQQTAKNGFLNLVNLYSYSAFSGLFIVFCFVSSFLGLKELFNHLTMSSEEWLDFDTKRLAAQKNKKLKRSPLQTENTNPDLSNPEG
jgi:cobalamin synthase